MKLYRKLRILRATKEMKNPDIALMTGASLQSVVNWASSKRCPKKLELRYAEALVIISNGYITLEDCGH